MDEHKKQTKEINLKKENLRKTKSIKSFQA